MNNLTAVPVPDEMGCAVNPNSGGASSNAMRKATPAGRGSAILKRRRARHRMVAKTAGLSGGLLRRRSFTFPHRGFLGRKDPTNNPTVPLSRCSVGESLI